MLLKEIESNQKYGTVAQLDKLAKYMQTAIPGSRFQAQGLYRGKPVPHIRVHQATQAEIDSIAQRIGIERQDIDAKQELLSTQFRSGISSFVDREGTVYSFVISSKGSGTGIAKKSLTPGKLGMNRAKYTRPQLIADAKTAVSQQIRDQQLAAILIKLVDIAAARGQGNLTPEELAYIKDSKSIISTDFGEILAPIMIMQDNETAEFPAEGNNPIVDVRVGPRSYAVKSLTGSGNSFSVISDLLDRYEAALEDGSPEKAKFEIVNIFNKKNPGKGKDKILQASIKAETAEAKAFQNLVGPVSSWNDLQNKLETVLRPTGQYMNYADFIKTIYPITMAGGWDSPAGLPADAMYYMTGGQKGAKPKGKSSGRVSYDRDPSKGAADILTYVLGIGLLNQATKGKEAEKYNQMMTDIVKKVDAWLGKIDITANGGLNVTTQPFSDLKFRFDYHAPSGSPANNLPGFIVAR